MATIEDILAVAKNKDNQILSAKSKLAKSAPSLPKATPKLPKVLPRYSKAGEETTQALSLANPLNRAENQATLRVLPKAIATGGLKGIESLIKAPAYGVAGLMTSEGDSKRYEESNKYVPKPSTLSPQTLAKAQSIADATKNFNIYPQKVRNFISGTDAEIGNLKTPGNRVLASTLQAGGQMAPAILTGGLAGVAAGYGTLGAGVYSSSMEEALKRGSDVKKSAGYALGQTAVELGTESLFGGIPGLGKGLVSSLSKKVGENTASKLVGQISKVVSGKPLGVIGEGFEETLATYLSPMVERATIDPNADDATLAQLAESFVTGALLSTVLQGGSVVLSSGKNISKPEDVQKLDPVEKQEFNSILEQKAYESNVRKGKIKPDSAPIEAQSNDWVADHYGLPSGPQSKYNPKTHKLNTGKGLNGNEAYKAAKLIYLNKVKELTEYIKNYEPKGTNTFYLDQDGYGVNPNTDIVYGAKRVNASMNDLWYSDFWRENGYKPGKKQSAEIAEKLINDSLYYEKDDGISYDANFNELIRSIYPNDNSTPLDILRRAETDSTKYENRDTTLDIIFGAEEAKPKPRLLPKPQKIMPKRNIEMPFAVFPGELAKGQREMPRAIFPAELPRAQALPQAPIRPVQTSNANVGAKLPMANVFPKFDVNTGLPIAQTQKPELKIARDNFNQEYIEQSNKMDAEYKAFMEETADMEGIETGAESFATQITGKGVARSKDIQRNADAAFKNNPAGRRWFKQTVEDPLYTSKGKYTIQTKKQLDTIFNDVVMKLGIYKASKESAGLQWLGDGKKQRRSGKELSKETTPYTLENLKQDFNYKMKNGRMAWENIVQAESVFKSMYLGYVDKINAVLVQIYPNVEANVAKLEAKLSKAIDEADQKKILQEIDDAIVGKRLIPRKDYMPHMRELNKNGFLVGLDNVINGATNIDPRMINISEFTKPLSRWTGFLQHRKDGDSYSEDAIGAMIEYIPQAEYKINIEPNIKVLRSVIKNLKESTIQTRNANSFIDELMQITNDLAGKTNAYDRIVTTLLGDEKGRKVLNALSITSNRMRANAVVGNVNTVIAQVFNLPNVVGYAKNPIDLAEGFTTAFKANTGNPEAKAILAKSMFLNERYLDRSFRRFDKGIVSDANKFFSWTMELGDKAVADGAFVTFYNQAIKKGMSEQDAILKADEMTRKSIAGRGIAEMPLSQKAKVTKLFVPFQVEVRNAFNAMKDLGSERDVLGFLGVFITSFLMNELLKATTGREIGINPIGVIKDSIKDGSNVGLGLVGNLASNMPGGSYIADAAANAANISEYKMQELFGQQDPSRFGTGNIALQTLAKPIGQAINNQNIDLLQPLTAVLPKFGGKQIERTIRGLQDMAVLPKEKINLTDKEVSLKKQEFPASFSPSGRLRFPMNPSIKNYITAPVLGVWSTKEGKQYLENESSTLGENQTKIFKEIVAEIGGETELYNFIQANRGVNTKAEVVGALKKSNLTDTQKRMLYYKFYGYK